MISWPDLTFQVVRGKCAVNQRCPFICGVYCESNIPLLFLINYNHNFMEFKKDKTYGIFSEMIEYLSIMILFGINKNYNWMEFQKILWNIFGNY